MNHWLMKTEAEEFSWDDLVKRGAKGEPWTGVRNFTARRHLKDMKKGDQTFIYHTGDERRIVGVGEIIKEHYRDPSDPKRVFVAVNVKALWPLKTPVTLATVKATPKLKDMMLAKYSRLSVMPVTAAEWALICKMGGVKP